MSRAGRPEVVRRDVQLALLIAEEWREEIERAIDKARKPATRSELDRWFRKEWYKNSRPRTRGQGRLHRFAPSEQTAGRLADDEVMRDECTSR